MSAMRLGVLQMELQILEAGNLKQKRGVVKSIKERLRNRFNVAVAEVGDTSKWQRATIAACTLANDGRRVEEVLQNVLDFVDNDFRVSVLDAERDFF